MKGLYELIPSFDKSFIGMMTEKMGETGFHGWKSDQIQARSFMLVMPLATFLSRLSGHL